MIDESTRFQINVVTIGFSFPRISGGYNLYRTIAGELEAAAELVGASGADASTIQTFSWVTHQPDTAYTYRLVPIGGGGIENWTDETVVPFRLDAAGDWIGPLPNAPTDLQLVPLSRGRMAVRWTYLPAGQETEPVGFYLYTTWEGVLDYGGIRGQVPYRPGRIHYEYETQSYADGERVGWAVRAYSPNGHKEQNLHQAFATARSTPPPTNPVAMVTVM